MPKFSADEVLTEGHVRFWLQFGGEVGANPNNEMLYAGDDTQYLIIGDADNPKRGDISPIRVPNPYQLKSYRNVGKSEEAPDLPTFPVTFLEKHGFIPLQLYNLGDCPVTYYRLAGKCGNPGDFEKGWTDYVLIYANAINSDVTVGGVNGWDSDDALEDEVSWTADVIYPVGKMAFDIELDEGTYTGVSTIDMVYGTPDSCADCRTGVEHIYAIGHNSNDRNLYYSLDGGLTWSVLAFATNANLTLTSLGLAGNALIATFGESAAPGGYYLSYIDTNTGVPGTATKVTSGVGSGVVINDVFVLSPRKVFFAADDGIIYRSINFAGGVGTVESGSTSDNFTRIDGVPASSGGTIMVAGTIGGDVFYSLDGGDTWTQTSDSVGGQVTGIAVLSEKRIWVTDDFPAVNFSSDLGVTWQIIEIPEPGGNLLGTYDIVFATDEVGYLAVQLNKSGNTDFAVYWTINGGASWALGESRFTQPIYSSAVYNRIAVPNTDNVAVNGNNAMLANGANGLYILKGAVK